jgi:hypothetical protein
MPRPGTDRLASTYGQLEFGAMGPDNQFRLNRMIATMDNALIEIADVLGSVKSQTNARTLVARIVTPETLMAWHRRESNSQQTRIPRSFSSNTV